MVDRYVVIAYRANHVETRRGCVVDSSCSDHSVGFFDNMASAVNYAFEIWKSTEGRDQYAKPEFTFLFDGLDSSRFEEINDSSFEPFEEFDNMLAALQRGYLIDKEEKRKQKEEEERRQREARKNDVEIKEREQLRILKEKYPDG